MEERLFLSLKMFHSEGGERNSGTMEDFEGNENFLTCYYAAIQPLLPALLIHMELPWGHSKRWNNLKRQYFGHFKIILAKQVGCT